MTARMSATILLPTYNEAENIVPLIRELLDELPSSVALLVIDDNSPDGTAARVRSAMKRDTSGRVGLLLRTKHPGLTNSLRDGIAAARTEAIGWMDCDFSHPPMGMRRLYDELSHGHDIVIASRYASGGGKKMSSETESATTILLSNALNTACRLLFGTDITDYTTGFLIAKKRITHAVPLRGDYGEYCIDFLVRAKRMGADIAEVPFVNAPRRAGVSKTAPNLSVLIRRGMRYLGTLMRLVFRI